MKVLENELREIREDLERISSRYYSEKVDIVEISFDIDYVIDKINKLIEFVNKLPK